MPARKCLGRISYLILTSLPPSDLPAHSAPSGSAGRPPHHGCFPPRAIAGCRAGPGRGYGAHRRLVPVIPASPPSRHRRGASVWSRTGEPVLTACDRDTLGSHRNLRHSSKHFPRPLLAPNALCKRGRVPFSIYASSRRLYSPRAKSFPSLLSASTFLPLWHSEVGSVRILRCLFALLPFRSGCLVGDEPQLVQFVPRLER